MNVVIPSVDTLFLSSFIGYKSIRRYYKYLPPARGYSTVYILGDLNRDPQPKYILG